MNENKARRFRIAALIFPLTSAVIFGAGAVAALSIPVLEEHLLWSLPAVIVASFPLGALIAWAIAPRLRAGYPRDGISG